MTEYLYRGPGFSLAEYDCGVYYTKRWLFLYSRQPVSIPRVESRAKVGKRRIRYGRKCVELFTNTICNSMKLRDLGCRFVGRKYVKKFQYGIAVSEKITIFASQ